MKYINKTLTIEKINLQKIANKFGTPFYSYSYSKLKENINNFKKSFRSFSPLICFAVKSNTNVNIIREIKKFTIIILLFCAVISCGKKGDPKYIDPDKKAEIKKFQLT